MYGQLSAARDTTGFIQGLVFNAARTVFCTYPNIELEDGDATEIDIDISNHIPQSVNEYLDENFNIIATVCNNAHETCPVFTGSSKHQIHHGFEDPADATGSDGEITKVYRRIRDEIRDWVTELKGEFNL